MIYIRTRAGVSTRCKIVRRQYVSVSIFYRSQRVEFINVEQRVLSDSFSAISFLPSCTMYRHPQMSRSTIFSSTVFSPFSPHPFFFFFFFFFFPPQKFPLFPIYSIRSRGINSARDWGGVQKRAAATTALYKSDAVWKLRYTVFFSSPLPFPSPHLPSFFWIGREKIE